MAHHRVLLVPSWQLMPVNKVSPKDTEVVCYAALERWKSQTFDTLLLCGGRFLSPSIQTKPSADIMHDWFVTRGVPRDVIICERRSLDTYENISYALQELEQNHIRASDITVCSQIQHALRIWFTFRRVHGVNVAIAPIELHLSFTRLCWQWFCLLYHWLDLEGTGPLARRMRAMRRRAAGMKT